MTDTDGGVCETEADWSRRRSDVSKMRWSDQHVVLP
jgi:hypothetical protein